MSEQFKKYLITVDKDMNILSQENTFLDYIGRDSIANLEQVVPPQDMMQLRNAVFAIDTGKIGLTCFRIRVAAGSLGWVAANISKTQGKDEVINMELSDIQSLKKEEVSARLDEMTGLLNKQAITDLAMNLTRMVPKKKFYFCLMDIDHFKNVNDVYGHMKGDEVIIDVAHIIRDCVGDEGTVGRIGGDEFMIVLEKVGEKPRCREVLAKVRETVENAYKEYDEALNITVSIGCSLFPDYSDDYGELFRLTDKMLYLAKTKGRNRYIIYTPEVHGDAHSEMKVGATSHQAAVQEDKIHTILYLMKDFLHQSDIPIRNALEKMLVAYDLDSIYVAYHDLKHPRYGILRQTKDKDQFDVVDDSIDLSFLEEPHFQEAFDANHGCFLNYFNLNKEKNPEIIRYMEETDVRLMVLYHMQDCKKPGYVAFINKNDTSSRLSARLSEEDVAELMYFSRMLELTSSDR